MKQWELLKIIVDNISHDKYAYNPQWAWNGLPPIIKENYAKVRSILIQWQEKGYITLIEDDETIFIVHPDKLPPKNTLLNELKISNSK